MIEKLKITENKKGGGTTDIERSEKSKSKKRSESSLDKVSRQLSAAFYPVA